MPATTSAGMRLTGGTFGFRITVSASCAAAAYRPWSSIEVASHADMYMTHDVQVALDAVRDPGAQVVVGVRDARIRTCPAPRLV